MNDTAEFAFWLARNAPKAVPADAAALIRAAGVIQRAAEAECSINMSESLRANLAKNVARARAKIGDTAERLGLHHIHQGDPRGSMTMLSTDPAAEHGYPVPARGLPARAFR